VDIVSRFWNMEQWARNGWGGARRFVTAVVAAGLAGSTALGVVLAAPAGASRSSGQLTQARKALLVLSDMPAGWVTTRSPNNNSIVGAAQLARCIGVPTSLITENPPSVNSPQFQNRAQTLTVNDNVSVFPSAKNAAAELAAIANPKTPGCMTTLASGPLKSKLLGKTPKGTSYGTPLVSPTDPATFGPGTAGYSLSVPVTVQGAGGGTVNVTVTQLFAVKGRLGQQITFTSIAVPFSIPLAQRLTSVAVGRL
jgi:hypothetical protein